MAEFALFEQDFRTSAARRRARLAARIEAGRKISDELIEEAAAFQARLRAIDAEFPEEPEVT